MQIIPLQPVASQNLSVSLSGQACTINVYQKSTGMFCDLLVNDTLIVGGVAALNGSVIVRNAYLGFTGDLAFLDTEGGTDPVYTGLGSRYVLAWFSVGEIAAAQAQYAATVLAGAWVPRGANATWGSFLWNDGSIWQ